MISYCIFSKDIKKYLGKEPLWECWLSQLCENSEFITSNFNTLLDNIESVDYIIDLENEFLLEENLTKFKKYNKKIILTLNYDHIDSDVIDRIRILNPFAIFTDFEIDESKYLIKDRNDIKILNKLIFIHPRTKSNKLQTISTKEIFIINDKNNTKVEYQSNKAQEFSFGLLQNIDNYKTKTFINDYSGIRQILRDIQFAKPKRIIDNQSNPQVTHWLIDTATTLGLIYKTTNKGTVSLLRFPKYWIKYPLLDELPNNQSKSLRKTIRNLIFEDNSLIFEHRVNIQNNYEYSLEYILSNLSENKRFLLTNYLISNSELINNSNTSNFLINPFFILNTKIDITQITIFLFSIFHNLDSPHKIFISTILIKIIENIQYKKRDFSTIYCTSILLKISPVSFLRFIKQKTNSTDLNKSDVLNLNNLFLLIFYTISECKINFKQQHFFKLLNHYFKIISEKFTALELSQTKLFFHIYNSSRNNFLDLQSVFGPALMSRVVYYKLRYNMLYNIVNHEELEQISNFAKSLKNDNNGDLFIIYSKIKYNLINNEINDSLKFQPHTKLPLNQYFDLCAHSILYKRNLFTSKILDEFFIYKSVSWTYRFYYFNLCIASNNIKLIDDLFLNSLININLNINDDFKFYDILNFSLSTYFRSVNMIKLSEHHYKLLTNTPSTQAVLLKNIYNAECTISIEDKLQLSNALQNVSAKLNYNIFINDI